MRFNTLLIAALLVGGFVWYTSREPQRRTEAPEIPMWTGPAVAHSAGLSPDEVNNIDIYKAAQSSVAYITSTVIERDIFFGDHAMQGIGSGFVISPEGQILTNNHVVSGSSQLEVKLPDKTIYSARIIMRMPSNDLALIKIDPKGKKLPVLKLGDSDALQVGQKVLAIGNPFGFSGTLTTGVVSALDRTLPGENQTLEGLIQTDASINSGNSGGPLLDSQGNVIGINTAIYGPSGGSVGIGFAMPINRAKRMLEEFKSGLLPAEPSIGVRTRWLSSEWARQLDLPAMRGLLVEGVQNGGPASRAGLKGADRRVRFGNQVLLLGGDYITHVDGKPIQEDGDDITRVALKKHAGETVELTIFRDGRTTKINVKLLPLDDGV